MVFTFGNRSNKIIANSGNTKCRVGSLHYVLFPSTTLYAVIFKYKFTLSCVPTYCFTVMAKGVEMYLQIDGKCMLMKTQLNGFCLYSV